MALLDILHNLTPPNLASLSFVYVLLPICLLAFYLVPKRFRPAVLLAASVGFYLLAQPQYFLLITVLTAADYLFVQAVVMLQKQFMRRLFLWLCVAFNVGLVGYFGVVSHLNSSAPPLGLILSSVSGIDAALEAYREDEPQTRNLMRFSLFLLFFPRLYAGPLTCPGDFYKSCGGARFDPVSFTVSFGKFAEGLLKYAVIGRSLFILYGSVYSLPYGEASVLSAWVLVLSFALALYFTLSGLADAARGIAGMFGIALPQNFYYPYQSRSVTDFFERFNMTLGAFIKRAVLEPLSPSPEKPDSVADCINLLLAGMLWGLWYGIRINSFLWGIFISIFLIMEKYFYPKALKAVPTLFCRGYTFFVTLLGLAVLAGGTPTESYYYFSHMFGFNGTRLFNERILYILSMNSVLIILSLALSTNILSLFVSAARKTFPRTSLVAVAAIDVCVLILFTSLTLGGGVL